MAIDPKFEDNYVPVSFRNKKVQWAKLFTPDDYKGKKTWTLQLIYDMDNAKDKAEASALKKAGFNIREKNGVTFLELKRSADKYPDWNEVYGPDGKTKWTEGDLGNGTLVNVNASAKKWDVCETITLYLDEVQVVSHVPYQKSGGFGDLTQEQNEIPF